MDSAFTGSYTSTLLAQFDLWRKSGKFCDFTIRAGDYEFSVHKLFVAAGSEYFAAMLRHDMKENRDGFVDIKHSNPEYIEKCVNFMYTGKAPDNVDEPVELLRAAHMFGLHELCYHMATEIMEKLDSNNVLSARQVAVMYGCKNLLSACDKFAADKFHFVMKSDSFKEIDFKFLDFLLSSDLKVFDDIKCKAIMTWVKHDEERMPFILDLISHVDIGKVELSYRKFLLDEPIVFRSPECLKYIATSMPERASVRAADYQGDCNPGIITVNTLLRKLERFDMEMKSSIAMHDLKEDMTGPFSSVIVDRCLYLIDCKPSMYQLKFTNMEASWEKLSSPLKQCFGPIVSADDNLYALDDRSSLVQRYDINENYWSEFFRHSVSNHGGSCMTIACGMLFLIGGRDSQVSNEVVEYVNIVSTRSRQFRYWAIPHLNDTRDSAAACTHKDTVYVIGGWSDYHVMNNVEFLLPEARSWTMVVDIVDLDRASFLSHCFDGKIYLVGGRRAMLEDDTVSVDVFDPKINSIISKFVLNDNAASRPLYSSAIVIM